MKRRGYRWLGALAAIAIVSMITWQAQRRQALEDAAQAARYEAIRNQRDYRSETVACSLRFARGGVTRATPFEAGFRWDGRAAELATSDSDVEGETWAEFYDSGSADAARALLGHFSADLSHRLLRQRLWYLYFRERVDETDALAAHWQPWIDGSDAGWQVRVRWLPTPHGLAEVTPPAQVPALDPAQGLVGTLQALAKLDTPPADWAWFGRDDPMNPDREAYREALRHTLDSWRSDPARLSEFQQRFEREHRHFYLIEAATHLGAGHVLVLRRFGQILGQGTLQGSAGEIGAMIASVQCQDAERPLP